MLPHVVCGASLLSMLFGTLPARHYWKNAGAPLSLGPSRAVRSDVFFPCPMSAFACTRDEEVHLFFHSNCRPSSGASSTSRPTTRCPTRPTTTTAFRCCPLSRGSTFGVIDDVTARDLNECTTRRSGGASTADCRRRDEGPFLADVRRVARTEEFGLPATRGVLSVPRNGERLGAGCAKRGPQRQQGSFVTRERQRDEQPPHVLSPISATFSFIEPHDDRVPLGATGHRVLRTVRRVGPAAKLARRPRAPQWRAAPRSELHGSARLVGMDVSRRLRCTVTGATEQGFNHEKYRASRN